MECRAIKLYCTVGVKRVRNGAKGMKKKETDGKMKERKWSPNSIIRIDDLYDWKAVAFDTENERMGVSQLLIGENPP